MAGALSDDAVWRLTSDVWCLSVAYIGPKSKTKRCRKTEIGTEVAHVTRDWYHFQGQKVKDPLAGAEAYCGGLPHIVLFTVRDRAGTVVVL